MSDRFKIILLLSPALSVVILLFVSGLLLGAASSLNYMPIIGLVEPNFDAYIAVFTSEDFYLSLLLTFYIAFTSTAISCVLALGSALLLRKTFVGKAFVNLLFQLNLTIPHIVGAIGILYLFSQSGSFARLGYEFNLISSPGDFPELVFDKYAIGILLQYIWKEIPFIGIIILANMQTIANNYEALSRTLGANKWQSFRYVLLPLISPGMISASVLVFAFAFGAYEIPAILGASYPPTLPVLAYKKFTDVDLGERPEAVAITVILTLISGLLIYYFLHYSRKKLR